jgi:ribonuclease HI
LTDDLLEPAAAPQVAPDAQSSAADADISAAPGAAVSIKIVFDGGSIGNPGKGYGSYQLTVRGKAEAPKRLDFGGGYTNNEAEYDTLIAALEAVVRRAKDPRRVQLDIRGDSQLVIKQITGAWKIKEPRMLARVRQVHALLQQFGSWKATWHDRANSVEALGH